MPSSTSLARSTNSRSDSKQAKQRPAFHRINEAELFLCQRLNQYCQQNGIHRFFTLISIAGNGYIWYGLILLLPIYLGHEGVGIALELALSGIFCTLIYKGLKHKLVRERPYILYQGIQCGTPPLDRYSFPSGHTLYAVCFNLILAFHLPLLAWCLLPFTLLVALSRVILGLHFPTDVAMGALIGSLIAAVAQLFS